MNFLAHAVLSMNDPKILTGNMISDHVKGKKQYDYSPGIQKGIRLHRAIDQFTDFHPITKKAKEKLHPIAGPYAGALIDIIYDHFLSLDEKEEPNVGWHAFSQIVYAELQARNAILPAGFARILPYMSEYNWLVNYRHLQLIEKSFYGLERRAKYFTSANEAFYHLKQNYAQFEDFYQGFFPELKEFVFKY
jgi:acyl carrier protein phosphodiesterase